MRRERPGHAADDRSGTAQPVQAWACGLRPDVRMNPVVKPEGDARSQVILRGRVDRASSRLAWEDRVAAEAAAPVLLVSDIDHGRALAHCYGTWADSAPTPRSSTPHGWDSAPTADDPIVVAYPTISNLDEFAALARVVLLGDHIDDPYGVDGSRDGLGLLPVRTTFARDKLTATTNVTFTDLDDPWTARSARTVSGYEIRHGATTPTGEVAPALPSPPTSIRPSSTPSSEGPPT